MIITALVWFYIALLIGLSVSLLWSWWRVGNARLDEQIDTALATTDFELWEAGL